MTTAEAPTWRGVHAVMVTPFDRQLEVDWGGLRANTEFLVASNVDVLVALGSEGEFYALTDDERRRVAEAVIETVQGRKPVIVGVSHPSSFVAAALARHACEVGADAVMATPPYFAHADHDGISEHFAAIGAAGAPLFLYNSPGRTGVAMKPPQIARIAREAEAVGVKQAAPDIAELADLLEADLPRDFAVIGGAEIAFWPALCVGARGNTATAASAIPEVFAEIRDAAHEGRLADGQRLYARLARLRRAYSLAAGQAAVVKALMERRGLAGGPTRPPVRALQPDVMQLVEQVAEEFASG